MATKNAGQTQDSDALRLIQQLVSVGKLDTVHRDIYFTRAADLSTPILSRAAYAVAEDLYDRTTIDIDPFSPGYEVVMEQQGESLVALRKQLVAQLAEELQRRSAAATKAVAATWSASAPTTPARGSSSASPSSAAPGSSPAGTEPRPRTTQGGTRHG